MCKYLAANQNRVAVTQCRGNDEERAYEFSIRADNFETDLSGRSEFVPTQTGRHAYARHDSYAPYQTQAPQAAFPPPRDWTDSSRNATSPKVDLEESRRPRYQTVFDGERARFVRVGTTGTEMGPYQATHTPQARLQSPPPRNPYTYQSSNTNSGNEEGDDSDVDQSKSNSSKKLSRKGKPDIRK